MNNNEDKKIGWDEYFMELARIASKRSSCRRRKVGAVAVVDKHVVATGYNGAPSHLVDCMERHKCMRDIMKVPSGERQEICRAVHAEQNLICQAAIHGFSLKGAVVYSTCQPCVTCAKLLINVGVKSIIYDTPYPDEYALDLIRESGIQLLRYSELKDFIKPITAYMEDLNA